VLEKKKPYRPPANVVYNVDGASYYGLDDRLVEALKNHIRKRLESKTLEIPRLPQVAGRILQLSQDPDTTVDEIVQVIATDPVLAARILVIANSAAYGGGDRVDGLNAALMRLGSRAVQDMVFAESVRMRIFSARSYRAILELSWKLSLGTAVACEALSAATGLERESAFLMGLLHDTGKPVLVNAIAESEQQNRGVQLGEDVVEILMSQLHEEIGGYVLNSWGMSPTIISAASAHHRYQGGSGATAAHRLVCSANLVCQHLGIGDVQRDVDFSIERVFADLGLNDFERISPILDTVQCETESMMAGLQDGGASAQAA
jgi:HD-like signal output (HDOD) protein